MKTLLLVSAGGFLGAMSRFYLTNFIQAKHSKPFPFGTFIVNLTGSFLLGCLFGLYSLKPELHYLIGTGFMGAFTTFSTFELESVELIRKGKKLLSFAYLMLSVMLGLTLALLGYLLAKNVL